MNSEVAWVLISPGTQVQQQIILDSDYLPDYLSVSYDYAEIVKIIILPKVVTMEMLVSIPLMHALLFFFSSFLHILGIHTTLKLSIFF